LTVTPDCAEAQKAPRLAQTTGSAMSFKLNRKENLNNVGTASKDDRQTASAWMGAS
jgi:hypothetical protein